MAQWPPPSVSVRHPDPMQLNGTHLIHILRKLLKVHAYKNVQALHDDIKF